MAHICGDPNEACDNDRCNRAVTASHRRSARLQRKHLAILRKRRDYLNVRIGKSGKDLSYDKAEAAALTWVLDVLDKAVNA
jgi:hypothetical protein